MYLYLDKYDKWWVNNIPGASRGQLYNPTPSKTLLTCGWRYFDGQTFHDDPTLTITSGPLPPLGSQYTVTATGAAVEKYPSLLGVFTRTERWWNGRPVFVNTHGVLLHHGDGDDGWVIGYKLGYSALRGSWAHHSPTRERSWRFYNRCEWRPAFITVTSTN